MDKQRWRQVKKLFEEANEKSDDSRRAFLEDIRKDDQELSSEIESLLDASEKSQEFLAFPATLELEDSAQGGVSTRPRGASTGNLPFLLQDRRVLALLVALVLILILVFAWFLGNS